MTMKTNKIKKAAKAAARKILKPVKTAAAAPVPDAMDRVLQEISALKGLLVHKAKPHAADAVMDAEVDALRRMLGELMDKRVIGMAEKLVALRLAIAARREDALHQADALLKSLGVVAFKAGVNDYLDPLIHTVVEERNVADLPDGVVVETIKEGYRTAGGVVIARANVAVNNKRS
ncbi:MAG: nucleotide exchange factor GrpE [Verrucomicrobia bacterium]|nr:nucleotide exchange factor GrpE [Verrucomicrobiota bacterium]